MRCIISPSTKIEVYNNLRSVKFFTPTGQVEIRAGHAEYFANLKAGEVVCILNNKKVSKIKVPESICHVINDEIKIVT